MKIDNALFYDPPEAAGDLGRRARAFMDLMAHTSSAAGLIRVQEMEERLRAILAANERAPEGERLNLVGIKHIVEACVLWTAFQTEMLAVCKAAGAAQQEDGR